MWLNQRHSLEEEKTTVLKKKTLVEVKIEAKK